MNGVEREHVINGLIAVFSPLTQKWQVGQNLKSPPVADKVGLQAQHSLTDGEGNLDGDSDQRSEPGAHVLHHKHEADHEASDASHPRQYPGHPVPVRAPSTTAECSEQEKGVLGSNRSLEILMYVRLPFRFGCSLTSLSALSLKALLSFSEFFEESLLLTKVYLAVRQNVSWLGPGQMEPKIVRLVFSFFLFSDL